MFCIRLGAAAGSFRIQKVRGHSMNRIQMGLRSDPICIRKRPAAAPSRIQKHAWRRRNRKQKQGGLLMPHTIVIHGPLGAGKTTMGSIMAHLYKNKVESQGGTVQLFSNYDLKGSQPMRNYTDWYRVAEARGSICVWDEAHRVIDSRQALKQENILTSHILTYARKMSSIQIFITPSILNLDTRVRGLAEVLISVRKNKGGITFDYYDFQAATFGAYGKFLHSRFIPSAKIKQIHRLHLFDSHSMVSGFPLPKTEREIEKFLAELERVHDKARTEAISPIEGVDELL
jgi:hypothetical protein